MRLAVERHKSQEEQPSGRDAILANARSAREKKLESKVDLSSPAPTVVDLQPSVGNELQRWVHSATLHILAKELATSGVSQSHPDPESSITSDSGFQLDSYMSKIFNPADVATSASHVLQTASADQLQSSQTPADFEQDEKLEDKKALNHFFTEYRGYCTVSRDADVFNMTSWRFSKNLIRASSAMKISALKLWGNMLSHIKSMLGPGGYDGVLFMARFRWDETPSKIRIEDLHASSSPHSGIAANAANRKASLAKILQTEFSLVMLLKKKTPSDGSEHQASDFIMLEGAMPTPLQVLDRQTARNLKMAPDQILDASSGSTNFERRLVGEAICAT